MASRADALPNAFADCLIGLVPHISSHCCYIRGCVCCRGGAKILAFFGCGEGCAYIWVIFLGRSNKKNQASLESKQAIWGAAAGASQTLQDRKTCKTLKVFYNKIKLTDRIGAFSFAACCGS